MSQTIGIIGGGQLGRMLSEPAIRLGFKVIVIDPTPDCPAHQVGAEQILGGYKDTKALAELAEKSDYLTIEFEHIDAEALAKAAGKTSVNPAPETVRLIQDKYGQKRFLKENGFPSAEFVEVNSPAEAEKVFGKWAGRMIIKSKTESFDGRGNIVITDKSALAAALDNFQERGIYAEKIVDFSDELAIIVAKDVKGKMISYPAVKTTHARNICIETGYPAGVSLDIAEKARRTAEEAVSRLTGAGVYGVEMFLDKAGQILINEIAPRVHNSGHYTMDMFDVSQFEQHIRAITGQQLAQPKPKADACCMVNILGERNGPVELRGVEEAEKIPGVSVYIYGKKPTAVDRKMGHINATAGTIEEAMVKARQARKLISI